LLLWVRVPPPAPVRKSQISLARLASLGDQVVRNSGRKFRNKILSLKTAKKPDKNIGSNFILILGKENF